MDRGGLVTLTAQQATVFYWIMTAVLAGAVFCAIRLWVGSRTDNFLRLSPQEISVPQIGFFSKTNKIVYFRDITEIRVKYLGTERLLLISTSRGKLAIGRSMLPSIKAFEELHQYVSDRVKAGQVKG